MNIVTDLYDPDHRCSRCLLKVIQTMNLPPDALYKIFYIGEHGFRFKLGHSLYDVETREVWITRNGRRIYLEDIPVSCTGTFYM